MVSETYKNSQDQALEERLSNMHEQMAGVTSRLDQTERALDLERAAMMYSFFGACKVKGKNPERWLAYVLDHIGSTKDEDLYKLLPEFWEDIN